MAASQALDTFLGSGDDAAPATAVAETQSTEQVDKGSATTAQVEADKAGEVEPADFDLNDPAEKSPQQRAGLRKALGSEREKRQEYERELAELKGKLSVLERSQSPQTKPEQPAQEADQDAEYWKDPKGYTQRLVENTRLQERLDNSEERARKAHPDFEEKVKAFEAAARVNPALIVEMNRHPDPGEFVYGNGATLIEVQKYGGTLEGMRAAIAKEEREKLELEYRKKSALTAAEQASTSSAGARSSSANTSTADSSDDDDSIGAILKRSRG
jgi:hypothetical protein